MASEKAAEGKGKGRKRQRKELVQETDLRGFKYLKRLRELLERLHEDATERDRAGNRRLFDDQYAGLPLFYFFNPVLDNLRGLQQSTELKKVHKALRIGRPSLGSLSEAAGVFEAERLEQMVRELSAQARPLSEAKEAELSSYPGVEVLPDGTFVVTTYGHWQKGEAPYILSVRLKLEELDALAGQQAARERPKVDRP